ncbi:MULTISPECIES: phosphoribosyltransferase-like protein [Microvirga]|uniref:phosphoribosyltransferase-like protein n=1 Tax=Microvirga TaxID=186650 RepID=UPI0021CA756C|nr:MULTISPECIES: hypothetical protein [unclassified Microvirga]
MKQALAERMLAEVMRWDVGRLGEEWPVLDRMARLKYDEYQQFLPGRKFIESLGLWLWQFKTLEEREAAYAWVKRRLVFISTQEMRQLIESAFPDVVQPILLRKAAGRIPNCAPHRLLKVMHSPEYQSVRRRSLFLGLSDGARMDIFRRAAGLSNEQVWQAYEVGDPKAKRFLKDLQKEEGPDARFETIFLIDDFTASGTSYIRKDDGNWTGKIQKAVNEIPSELVTPDREIHIILYIATTGALVHIGDHLARFAAENPVGPVPKAAAVYTLSGQVAVSDQHPEDAEFLRLIRGEGYYRTRPMDSHEKKGRTDDMRLGYAGCALPVVLVHNTPNNSVYLLWANEPEAVHGLFPRVTRHKDI